MPSSTSTSRTAPPASRRELLEVPLATAIPEGVTPFTADCTARAAEAPADDILALAAGYAWCRLVPPENPAG